MNSSIAVSSVNKITSTIKSTLEKGNSFIRSELYHSESNQKNLSNQQNNNLSRVLQVDQKISAYNLFQDLKRYTSNNEIAKINIINILNFAQIKWNQFIKIPNKTSTHYIQYLQKFKKIQHKLNSNLDSLIVEDSTQKLNTVKMHFKRIIQYLNQRARKYADKNKQIVNLMRKKQNQEFQQEHQEQAIKQEMLQILQKLKGQAINISSDLKKDDVVIHQINKKQDKQMEVLSQKSSTLNDMMKSQNLGFFKLISYAAIGIVVWIFTLLFILIF